MIKIGFLLNFTVEYKGGINYLKNLFYALKEYHSDEIEITLFVPRNIDIAYEELFSPYAKIVRTKILQRKTASWMLSRVFEKYLGFDPFVFFLLRNHGINCVSHSNYVYPLKDIKTINWVPDFQYLHYPNLWTEEQIVYVKKQHKKWIHDSDSIVVSSYAAKKDLLSQYPDYANKVEVLHFVSQPEHNQSKGVVEIPKDFGGNFFYLPNQFWSHKNHIVVFKAIKVLKDKGINILLITTGSKNDLSGQHFENLQQFVTDHNLERNILFWGLIPYPEVFTLMKESVAIINPSYFEGWSSTVEESKSIEKTIILSDISVHREQDPVKGIYFDPDNEHELADILELVWNNKYTFNQNTQSKIQSSLTERTQAFSDLFYGLVMSLFKHNRNE